MPKSKSSRTLESPVPRSYGNTNKSSSINQNLASLTSLQVGERSLTNMKEEVETEMTLIWSFNLRRLGSRMMRLPTVWVVKPHSLSSDGGITAGRRHVCVALSCLLIYLPFFSRSCGGVFCNRCSSHSLALPHHGIMSPVRVCNRCHVIFQCPDFMQPDGSRGRSSEGGGGGGGGNSSSPSDPNMGRTTPWSRNFGMVS